MRLRRTIAIAAATLVVAPVVMRAQDLRLPPPPPDRVARAAADDESETELRLTAFSGTGHYTDCDGSHSLQYSGLNAGIDYRERANDTIRVRAVGSLTRVQDTVTDDDGGGSVERGLRAGMVGQIGGDWTHFGFMAGLGLYSFEGSNLDRTYLPMVNVTFRLGDRHGIHVLLGALDEAAFLTSAYHIDLVAAVEALKFSIGFHASPIVEDSALLVLKTEGRIGPISLGAGGGFTLARAETSWLGHITLAHHF